MLWNVHDLLVFTEKSSIMCVETNPKAVQRQLIESGKFSFYMDNDNLKKLKNFFLSVK